MKTINFTIFAILIIYLFHYFDLNDKFLYRLFHSDKSKFGTNYEYNKQFKAILEIEKNLSGITYNPTTDTLFVITNSPRSIYELNKNGEFLREIKLKGFKDTEDITYIKDDMFAILDEKNDTFYIVNIYDDTTKILLDDYVKKFTYSVKNFYNFGLEGIGYNEKNDEFYIVNERNPKKVISIKGIMNDTPIYITTKTKISDNNSYLGDFSAIYFDNKKDELFILSDESSLLGKVDNLGNFTDFLDLYPSIIIPGSINIEGVTKDNDGNIYIVGEPNFFLSIKKVENKEH